MELMFEWKKGWMEVGDEDQPRVYQWVDFRVVPPEEVFRLADGPRYSGTGLGNVSVAMVMAKLLHVETTELFDGTLRLGTPEALQRGQTVEIKFQIPLYECEMKFLAEILAVDSFEKMKERVCSAGLHVVAADREDMTAFNEAVEARKVRK